jgi:hypothetical protein
MVRSTADLQVRNRVMGLQYCEAGGGIVHTAELSKCAECMI